MYKVQVDTRAETREQRPCWPSCTTHEFVADQRRHQPLLPAFKRPISAPQAPKGRRSAAATLKHTRGCLRRKLSLAAAPTDTESNWISHGRTDVEAGQPSTAYARFTKLYKELVGEHCTPDNNRNRELDRALEILKRTCECGNHKVLMSDGKLSSTCQDCQDLDTRQRHRTRRA